MKSQNSEPAAEMVVDLSTFLPADTATLHIVKPGTATRTGWSITFAGPSHPKAVAWANESARESLHRARQIEAAQVNGRKYKPEEKEVEEARRDNVRWVVARIVDWTPVRLAPDAAPVAFSEAAATDLLIRPDLGWVYVQVLEFLNDERSFTKASGTA